MYRSHFIFFMFKDYTFNNAHAVTLLNPNQKLDGKILGINLNFDTTHLQNF